MIARFEVMGCNIEAVVGRETPGSTLTGTLAS